MYVSYHYSITCNHTIPLPYCTIGIVELHENAKIWAESEGEGKGCTFFVLVPVHSHRALDVSARGQTSINARETIASSSLIDPIHEFAHIDLTPESCQLALAAVSLIQCLSAKDPSKPLSPRQPLALVIPVVPVWKPTILVVDDSAMNRKVDTCYILTTGSIHAHCMLITCLRILLRSTLLPSSHNLSPPHPPCALDVGPYVNLERICLLWGGRWVGRVERDVPYE